MASGPPFPQPPSPYDSSPSPYAPAQGAGESPWLAPASLPPANGMPAGAGSGRTAMYELRPLSTGEVLDRTFSLYRSRFLLFAGISSLSAVVQMLSHASQLVAQHYLLRRHNLVTLQATSLILAMAVGLLFFFAAAVTHAATVYAMSEVYLGRDTSVSASLRATAGKWYRYIGVAIWQVGSLIWLPAVALGVLGGLLVLGRNVLSGTEIGLITVGLVLVGLAAYVVGVLFYLRNGLAIPALVIERLKVRPAMRRSKVLATGAKGKVFLVLLLCGVLYGVVGGIAGVLNLTMMFHPSLTTADIIEQIISLAVVFVGYAVVSPVMMIGTGLVYFDQRVRKEAFDVAVLLGDESPGLGTEASPLSPSTSSAPGGVMPGYGGTQPVRGAADLPGTGTPAAASATPAFVAEEPPAATLAEPPVTEPEGGASGL